jgi:Metallo-beta-lactamase superfamily
MRWDVDGVRVTRVVEHVMPFPVDFFAEATPADVLAEPWLVPDFVDSDGRYLMSFHTFVIEAGERRILVDTCTGNAKDRPLIPEFDHRQWSFLADLTAAGFPPETIDTVVCTHLHVDHVGWNTTSSTVDGGRPSRRRATCSAPRTSTTGRARTIPCTRPPSRTPFSRCSRPDSSIPWRRTPSSPGVSTSARRPADLVSPTDRTGPPRNHPGVRSPRTVGLVRSRKRCEFHRRRISEGSEQGPAFTGSA